jgi:hypothetical protein
MLQFQAIRHMNYLDRDGNPDAVQPFEEIQMETQAGTLVPIYEVEDHGRKNLAPVRLFKNGNPKSIPLQNATVIKTSVGEISTELVTFYESGAICRLFPLNGKLSGYWSEKNEYKLTKELVIPTQLGVIKVRPIYLHFYETGELKSITFWPAERVEIKTPLGVITVKTGISFHKSGALSSCEPHQPLLVDTPLGSIEAYDPDPNGMNGESNSLSFNEHGKIIGLSTTKTVVVVTDKDNAITSFSPLVQRSRCSDTAFIVEPLKIKFIENEIVFRNGRRPKQSIPATAHIELKPFTTEKNINCAGSCSI